MNPAAWAAAISTASFLFLLFGVAHVTGKMTEKLDSHGKSIIDHNERLNEHEDHLNRVDMALLSLEKYQEGFAAATKLAHLNETTK